MTAKQYLQSYRRLKGNYSAMVEEYKAVESEMISLKSPNLGDRVKSSAKNDPIGEIVCKLEDKKAKIGLWMIECNSKCMVVENQIREMNKVNDEYYVILSLRYILYKDWKFICSKLNLSRTQANVVHGKALQEFDSIFGKLYHNL